MKRSDIHWHLSSDDGLLEIDDLRITEARELLKNHIVESRVDYRLVPRTNRTVSLQFKSLTRAEISGLLAGLIRLPRITEGRARTVCKR